MQPHDHVLDIGCGSRQTTREAARTARVGRALGVDISAPAIERARDLARALRPAGRLVMLIWQARERNEWDVAIRRSLAGPENPAAPAAAGPDPFSLADPPTVEGILTAARFSDVTFTDVHEHVYYGPDVAAALDWVRGFTYTSDVLKRLDPAAAADALGRLRETLVAHMSNNGVWFDSRAWIVTACRN